VSWELEKLHQRETALGERAPYFDRRETTLGFTRSTGFCFALLPLALILGVLRRQSLAYFGIVSRSESYKLLVSQTFLGQVVVYDIPRGIRHVGS
jgi:hypothetical protein